MQRLGYEMENYPELCTTIMNSANDVCVQNFCRVICPLTNFDVITRCVENFACIVSGEQLSVENIVKYDAASRKFAQKIVNEVVC